MNTLSSRSIARRTILAITGVAACSAALLTTACGTAVQTAAGDPPPVSPSGSVSPSSGVPVVGSVAGLPGWLYYADDERVVRLTRSGVKTVLVAGAYTANVSPDGSRVAFVDEGASAVVVTDRDGKHPRTVLRGVVGVGYEPVWSPDSRRLLVGRGSGGAVTIGTVTVASGRFTALAHRLEGVIHPMWSADGRRLGYATGTCQIGTADVDGGSARLVPVFGDRDGAVNPQRRRSCDPYSISVDGGLLAVNQRTGDQTDGDIGRDLSANAIVDVRSGDNVGLPVTGSVTAILFLSDGGVLVRVAGGGGNRLVLLGPDRVVKAQISEPASVKGFRLLAYTPN